MDRRPFDRSPRGEGIAREDQLAELLRTYVDRLSAGESLDEEKILSEQPSLGRDLIRVLRTFEEIGSAGSAGSNRLGTLGGIVGFEPAMNDGVVDVRRLGIEMPRSSCFDAGVWVCLVQGLEQPREMAGGYATGSLDHRPGQMGLVRMGHLLEDGHGLLPGYR